MPGLNLTGPDTVRAMPVDELFDYWGVRLNGPKAAGKNMRLGFNVTDTGKKYTLTVRNGALTDYERPAVNPDASLTMNKSVLDDIQLGTTTLDAAIAKGAIKVEGDKGKVKEFFSLLDVYPFWFDIVTP